MKHARKLLIFGAALVVLFMLVAVARAGAVQDWYHTVTVQGRVTMWLLDDHATVDGLLLDGGSQIRMSPRVAAAMVPRVHMGDTIAVVGRGGRGSSFGRVVHARILTINGQTLTSVAEPHAGLSSGPPPSHGPHGPGRAGPPPPSPRDAGRGPVPPPPPVASAVSTPPPPPAGTAIAPPPPAAAGAESAIASVQPPLAALRDPGTLDPPPPPAPEAHGVTVRGQIQAVLVGERGEVVGLALKTGEQVRFAPRVGEGLAGRLTNPLPEVVVDGDAVLRGQGTVVRATQITAGTQTWIVR